MIVPLVISLAATSAWTLGGGAEIVDDDWRQVARIEHVNLYDVGTPQPIIGTKAFKDVFAKHPGERLVVCARSRATKAGSLVVWAPRMVGEMVQIPTPVGDRYRTNCAEFTVVASPKSHPGFLQVTNAGVTGRVDRIIKISIGGPQ